MHGLFVALRLLKNREMRRLMAALVAYSLTEHATWLALMVFAFQRGGVAETGVALFAMLVPAAFIAPIASRAIGPLGSGRALTLGFAIQAVLLAATAAVLVADAPAGAVYAAALGSSVSLVLTRPAAAALLPTLARSVEELTAANATSSLVAMIGLFAGPAAAGIVLAGTSLSTVFWLTAALMAIATLLVVGFAGADDRADAVDGSAHAHEAAHLTTDGGTDTAEARSVRLLIGLQGLVFALVGALDVAFVAMAVELLERSEATAGALNAAHGFGAFVGAVASLSLVGRRRLTPAIAVASSAAGLSVAALAAVGDLWPALGLLALAGAGRAVSGVASRTMLQGLSPSDTLGRVFGALEGTSMLALAIGALLFSVAADRLGLETAFMVTGLLLPSVIGLSLARLAAIDRQRPTVDADLVTLLRSTPVFGPLPPYAIEHMIANLGRRTFAADETIISTGDDGDEIFVIVGGDVDVIRANGDPVTCTAGDYFGEIALLFDRPRTATVVAGADGATTLTIDRETYRSAIGVNALSHGRVAATARRLLDDNGAD
jgi:predicted MFS family arabinose efflux permease